MFVKIYTALPSALPDNLADLPARALKKESGRTVAFRLNGVDQPSAILLGEKDTPCPPINPEQVKNLTVVHHSERGEKKHTIMRHYFAMGNPFHDEWLVIDAKCSDIICGWSLLNCMWHDPEKPKVVVGNDINRIDRCIDHEYPVLASEYFWHHRVHVPRKIGQKEIRDILQHGFERLFSNAALLAKEMKQSLQHADLVAREPKFTDMMLWGQLMTPILRHTDLGKLLGCLQMEPRSSWVPGQEE